MTDPVEGGASVLLAEDDDDVRETTRLLLLRRGFRVQEAADGVIALDLARAALPDIAVVDVAMPRMDGFALARELTALSVPVVFLTARDLPTDIAGGLLAGADDYVTKPFDPDVLAARLTAVLRRTGTRPVRTERIGTIVVEHDAKRVLRGSTPVPLSATEFRVLQALLANRGAVLSREQVVAIVWGSTWQDPRIVDTNVQRLRRKLGSDAVETVRGFGYRIAAATP
ncbi:response regulator transcription factor [Microbacterium sp. M1A1_1b]|uniref:response regulator transcription factor n=1 Tax=Curtobacterium sp. VKM Ac-2922 TaxID=2929475 RepID=UPI001FB25F01|nr:response regulator transcription factor [Curtobacterium sp. VKM Ac-2922]MCJ1714920.1 response regulator transcription factor [Curtobacterium sp. VKM Ac-2922]